MKKKKHKSDTSQNQKIETKENSDKQGKEKKIEKVSIESKLEEDWEQSPEMTALQNQFPDPPNTYWYAAT